MPEDGEQPRRYTPWAGKRDSVDGPLSAGDMSGTPVRRIGGPNPPAAAHGPSVHARCHGMIMWLHNGSSVCLVGARMGRSLEFVEEGVREAPGAWW